MTTPSPQDRAADRVGETTGWSVSDVKTVDGEFMVVGGQGDDFGLIAQVPEEIDARLIAAAPDLLASLKEVSDMLFARPDMVAMLRPLMGFGENAICDRASAAIAKATSQ